MNKKSIHDTLELALEFVIEAIKKTIDDDSHSYGVKFEEVLNERK